MTISINVHNDGEVLEIVGMCCEYFFFLYLGGCRELLKWTSNIMSYSILIVSPVWLANIKSLLTTSRASESKGRPAASALLIIIDLCPLRDLLPIGILFNMDNW